MAEIWASVKSGQFFSFSRMAGSEFWMVVASRVHTMLPRMPTFSELRLDVVIPYGGMGKFNKFFFTEPKGNNGVHCFG